MSFLSFDFAVFVGLALLIFHLASARSRPALLLALSYVFYLSWTLVYTALLAAVTVGVYTTALWIEGRGTERGKRAIMAMGVMSLLVLLFAFKSAAWFLTEFYPHGASVGADGAIVVIIPLGLSYYVFKMVGYLLDVYWEVVPAQRDLVAVALYGAFFPQIVSGPIQRAQNFFEQMDQIKNPDPGQFLTGLRRILFGLFKKVVVADRLSVLVGNVHRNPAGFSSWELLMGAYCFSIQMYADFSGITDIALGIGQLFGVKGPENFDLPYFSPNIQVFWRKWHMSLTTWLTDYLFTPLRMSFRKLGTVGLCLAIFITMIAIGLWHGLAWTYLVFGIVNGIFMTISTLTLKRRNLYFQSRAGLAVVRRFAAPLLTFHLVVFSHILFRAESLPSALHYLGGLVPGWQRTPISATRFDPSAMGMAASTLVLCLALFFGTEAVTWAMRQRFWIDRFFATPIILRRAAYTALIVTVLFLFKGTVNFIYAGF